MNLPKLTDAYPLAISSDGQLLAAGSARLLRIIEVGSGAVLHTWRTAPHTTEVEFLPCGERLALADTSGTLEIRRLDGELIHSFPHPDDRDSTIGWCNRYKTLLQWNITGTVRIIDVQSGNVKHQTRTPHKVTSGRLHPDGRRLALAFFKAAEYVTASFSWWYGDSLEQIAEYELDNSKNRIRWGFSSRCEYFWCINESDLEIYSETLVKIAEVPLDGAAYESVEFAPDDSELTLLGSGPCLRLDFPTLKVIQQVELKPSVARYSSAAEFLILGARGGSMVMPWKPKSFDIYSALPGEDGGYGNSVWESWTEGNGNWRFAKNLWSALLEHLEQDDPNPDSEEEYEMFLSKEDEELFHKIATMPFQRIPAGVDSTILEVDGVGYRWQQRG